MLSPEVADRYGANGFDVLCMTEHAVRLDDPLPSAGNDRWVSRATSTSGCRKSSPRSRDARLQTLAASNHRPDAANGYGQCRRRCRVVLVLSEGSATLFQALT